MTRPVTVTYACDTCSAYHTLIGAPGYYIVNCSIQGTRHAPMVDAACDRKPREQYIWPVAKPVDGKVNDNE